MSFRWVHSLSWICNMRDSPLHHHPLSCCRHHCWRRTYGSDGPVMCISISQEIIPYFIKSSSATNDSLIWNNSLKLG
eukprot:2980810-Amphidinium_carterae.1